jgi:uncharacterized membrane protein
MRDGLTRPTTGRLALWLVLSLVWLLFLVQDLAMDPGHKHFSWAGAVFWLVVLVWLVAMTVQTFRRRQSVRAKGH